MGSTPERTGLRTLTAASASTNLSMEEGSCSESVSALSHQLIFLFFSFEKLVFREDVSGIFSGKQGEKDIE